VTAEHKLWLVAAIVACMVYTVGIPVVLIFLLRTRRDNPKWRNALGFLFINYETKFWWYEVVSLVATG
jgi:hypothetical protein